MVRHMVAPSHRDWSALKRVGRYIVGCLRLVQTFVWQKRIAKAHAHSDSDWAVCTETRRSTSGGVIQLGSHSIKHWSTTQATVALSSGEAEYAALVKAAGNLLGVRSMMADLGITDVPMEVHTDSSAAIGVASRTGLGKLRPSPRARGLGL